MAHTDYEEMQRLLPVWVERAKKAESQAATLSALVTKLHAAKGRYHTQLAACDLFDAVGLKNERPTK